MAIARFTRPPHVATGPATGLVLTAITAAAAGLRLFDLGRAGLGNLFYAAAIRSEGLSLHNFFYAAFDPAGTLTVDKPPLALWLQVLSTKALGFHGVAIILPMALAGTAAVPLLFGAARRSHGFAAALAAAAVLAVFPESVATARDSTMDALMMALLAAGAWLLVAAVESRRAGLLLAWAVLMGVVFNVKFFEGCIVLPAAAVYVGVRWRGEWRARLPLLASGAAVTAVIALSWVTFVQLTPASHRPLVMNDAANSPYGLMLRYNGVERVRPGPVAIFEPVIDTPAVVAATALAARQYGVGDAGPLRLFRDANGTLLGTTILLSLLGVAMVAWRRRDWLDGPGALWTAWLLSGAVLFTFSNRSAAQYTEAYAPAIAMMAGVGLVEGWRASDGRRAAVLPLSLAVVAAFAWWAVRIEAPLATAMHRAAIAVVATSGVAVASLAIARAAPARGVLRALPAVAVLALPLVASLWIARAAPRGGQITRPNPLVYATRDAPSTARRLVPAEAMLRAAQAVAPAGVASGGGDGGNSATAGRGRGAALRVRHRRREQRRRGDRLHGRVRAPRLERVPARAGAAARAARRTAEGRRRPAAGAVARAHRDRAARGRPPHRAAELPRAAAHRRLRVDALDLRPGSDGRALTAAGRMRPATRRAVGRIEMSQPLPAAAIERLAPYRPLEDLRAMRVVTESPWARIPPLLGADATTLGHHVLIRPDRYRPDTAWGLALLAHECGHIRQWRELGVTGFVFAYARGLLTSRFRHDAHPMEAPLVAEQRRIEQELSAGPAPA